MIKNTLQPEYNEKDLEQCNKLKKYKKSLKNSKMRRIDKDGAKTKQDKNEYKTI